MSGTAEPFVYTVRVGYADTDKMGFAHHARFLVYLESARTELLRTTGDSYREWEERGVLLPVVEANIKYNKPAYYDDVLSIRVTISELSRVRVRFEYEVNCEERKTLIATGSTGHVFMNREGRPIRVGEEFMAKLRP